MSAQALQKPASGYSVAKAQGKCAICGKDVAPGEKIMAALHDFTLADSVAVENQPTENVETPNESSSPSPASGSVAQSAPAAPLGRVDVCLDCWPDFPREHLLGFWQTTVPHPSAKKKIFVDDEVLCELFERLGDSNEPGKIHFRFVLGLILMRKRRLVYEATRHEGDVEIWSMRFRGKEAVLDLVNPRLNEEQVANVAAGLGEILSEEL